MTIISYRPYDDQFWIACTQEEAEKWFVPLLDEQRLRQYLDVLKMNEERKRGKPDWDAEYNQMIKETMKVDEVAYAYFNVSRDLSVCYSDVAHHPFHQLWNGYSPFEYCDHVDIKTPDELKHVRMTRDGKCIEWKYDQAVGCLVGGAVGDALGYAVEFQNWRSIAARYGEHGITRYELDNRGLALISDDTQMSLFTGAGVLLGMTRGFMRGIAGRLDTYCRYTYVDWLHTQEWRSRKKGERVDSWLMDVPGLYSRRAPGTTCMTALRAIDAGQKVHNNSCGCGGVMRTAPIALVCYLHDYAQRDLAICDMVAAEAARITHQHPLGFLPSAVLNDILMQILDGKASCAESLVSVVQDAANRLPSIVSEDDEKKTYGELWPHHVSTLQEILRKAMDLAATHTPDPEAIESIGGGWTGHEALAIAVYSAVKHADSFEDAITSAVNHSGDSDSTGAICGNIVGTMLGRNAIPVHYTENLELLDIIEEMGNDLYTGCIIGEFDPIDTPEKRRWAEKYCHHHW